MSRTTAIVSVVLVLCVFGTVVGGVSTGDRGNERTRQTCTPQPWEPELRVLSLHTTSTVVAPDEPQRIVGRFEPSPESECPVTVVITLTFDSETYDVPTDRGDRVSTDPRTIEFRYQVHPGEVRLIEIPVVSSTSGTHEITARIAYYPIGNENRTRSVPGVQLTYAVSSVPVLTATDRPGSETRSTRTRPPTVGQETPTYPGPSTTVARTLTSPGSSEFVPEFTIVGLVIVFGALLLGRLRG